MGSVKFKDLKAYVRYDGSGRVVAGSLVFRKKKPKNGRWSEISSNLCCNASGTTTTTTTQGGGGGVTPTAFVRGVWYSLIARCQTTTQGNLLFYSASAVTTDGVAIFQDAGLTTPVTEGYIIQGSDGMTSFIVGAGGVLSTFNYETCPPTFFARYQGFSSAGVCTSNATGSMILSTGTTIIVGQTIVYENGSPFYVSPEVPAYITFPGLTTDIYQIGVGGVILGIIGSC